MGELASATQLADQFKVRARLVQNRVGSVVMLRQGRDRAPTVMMQGAFSKNDLQACKRLLSALKVGTWACISQAGRLDR
jgi:hypothetical protein